MTALLMTISLWCTFGVKNTAMGGLSDLQANQTCRKEFFTCLKLDERVTASDEEVRKCALQAKPFDSGR